MRNYSVFALVDAIGVRTALETGRLSSELFIKLRGLIDALAKKYLDISFISLGDSLILKSNWTVGMFDSEISYTYSPERMVSIIDELALIYEEAISLPIYGVLTQGTNEYYGSSLLHVSESGNHICLNSLGLPFERLLAIDAAARMAIRKKVHPAAQLYIDEEFFRSLDLKYQFRGEDSPEKFDYRSKMDRMPGKNLATSRDEIFANLKSSEQ